MDALRELGLFESRDVLTRRFERAHNRTPNATKCRQIVANLMQGRQYWDSASQAGDLIKPLLLYYGALSFCRSLILFSRVGGGEETLSKSHGLQTSDWGPRFGRDGVRAVLDFTVTVSTGTMTELAAATKGSEVSRMYVGPYPSYRNFIRVGDPNQLAGVSVSLREALRRVPELAAAYEEVTGNRSAAYPVIPFKLGDFEIDLNVLRTERGPADWSYLRNDIGIPAGLPIEIGMNSVFGQSMHTARIRTPPSVEPEWLFSRLALDTSEKSWLIGSISGNQSWNQLTVMFAIAFFLGMLVRYHPTIWLEINSQSRGDEVLPLLREAKLVVEETLPKLVLQHFELLIDRVIPPPATAAPG